jgi:hypothetical protein
MPALLNFPKGTLFNRAIHFRKTSCPPDIAYYLDAFSNKTGKEPSFDHIPA